MSITVGSGITIQNGIVMGDIPIISAGANAHTVVANTNARMSTAQAKFGTASYTSNSTAGYLRITPFSDFVWGTGDFTMEMWLRPTSVTSAYTLVGFRPASTEGLFPNIYVNNNNTVNWYISAAARITSALSILTLNEWNSIAVVRLSGNTKMYVNGTQTGSTYVDNNNYQAGACIIGANDFQNGASFFVQGNLDEIRFSNVARYSGNYTPATGQFWPDTFTRLLLHCDGANNSTSFTDSSSAV
jgi:Concanavalin A-like lectin/glucanases superfamily